MVEIPPPQTYSNSLPTPDLLFPGEFVAIVDDSPEIVLLLSHYLTRQGFELVQAGSAKELLTLLNKKNIALILLDIGLPDRNGDEILSEIIHNYPNVAVIMITGTIDIQVALDCLRQGADDYLIKPVSMRQFNHTIFNTLKKRRLAIENSRFQQDLQKTNTQMRFLHNLNLIMNTAYLNALELKGVMQAILYGITSNEGLRFNRAFLALFDESGSFLEGAIGVGPSSKEDAGRIWSSIEKKAIGLLDLLKFSSSGQMDHDIQTNQIIQTLKVSSEDNDHIFIKATQRKKSILVTRGIAEDGHVPNDLIERFGIDSFVAVPLYSPARPLGIIVVDNFVTNKKISLSDINSLEILASQASLAIEQSHLYSGMQQKISELEQMTDELEKSNDLLVEAERRMALGNMSAQLLHSIRNPITSIGGTSRLLSRKTKDDYSRKFLAIITEEANKIESVLDDISSFTEDTQLVLANHAIYPLIRRSVMVFYAVMKKNSIDYSLTLNGEGPVMAIDEKKIRQAFLHLIRNSIEAMTDGGSLSVTAELSDTAIILHFTDTGPGIPESNLTQIKNPFYTTKTYGNGMGLTLVEQIITAHNGSFHIRGVPRGGTQATITLPFKHVEKRQ